MSVTIWHNPNCGTSRNTLELLRSKGIEPQVREYLKDAPTRDEIVALLKKADISARELIRNKGDLYTELKLDDMLLSDNILIDAMAKHPELINRPVVITKKGAALCRPAEKALGLL